MLEIQVTTMNYAYKRIFFYFIMYLHQIMRILLLLNVCFMFLYINISVSLNNCGVQ